MIRGEAFDLAMQPKGPEKFMKKMLPWQRPIQS